MLAVISAVQEVYPRTVHFRSIGDTDVIGLYVDARNAQVYRYNLPKIQETL